MKLFAKVLAAGAALNLICSSNAEAQFGGLSLPGLGGGGGGTDAITEQAKVKAVNQIFDDIGKNAFEGGKIVLSKKKWACQRLREADVILSAISQPKLSQEASNLRVKLFCDVTERIPDELLAPEKPKADTQET